MKKTTQRKLRSLIERIIREEQGKVTAKPIYSLDNYSLNDLKKKWRQFNDGSYDDRNKAWWKELHKFFEGIGFIDHEGVGITPYTDPKLIALDDYAEKIS